MDPRYSLSWVNISKNRTVVISIKIYASPNLSPFFCSQSWPDADVPEFKPLLQSMYHKMSELGHRVLSIMAIGLGLVSVPNLKMFAVNVDR